MTTGTVQGPLRFDHRHFDPRSLKEAKAATAVSVCLPARNEAATIGRIVGTVRAELLEGAGLVDEVIVADDASSDGTAAAARAAGALVVVVDRAGTTGKGAAMAAAMAASQGDVVVFCDADVENFSSHFVVGLLGPLLTHPGVCFVKATYRRPLAGVANEGGRVTELVAKPLLEALVPDVACFSQPLAGEVAARRHVLEELRWPSGYGVDVAVLIDVAHRVGLGSMAEVDLGERVHRNRPLAQLVPQARSVIDAILARADLSLAGLRPPS